MTSPARLIALPVASLLLVAGVLGIQLASGGGSFAPLEPADPCVARQVTSTVDGIDGLTERLVLLGLDGAACRLGVSREAFTLDIAQSPAPSDAQVDALRAGLLHAVQVMKDDGTLPPASDLVDEALDTTDMSGLMKAAIKLLPDALVDATLKTDDVLTRTIESLNLRDLLTNLDDPSSLNEQVQAAVTQAVKDSITERLRGLL